MNAFRDVHEDAVAKFGGVVEAEDGGPDVCGAAEMFEDAFAAKATNRIFADGAEFVVFLRTGMSDRRKAINISGGECSDAAVAETIADKAGEKRIHRPSERFLARGAEFHSGHI